MSVIERTTIWEANSIQNKATANDQTSLGAGASEALGIWEEAAEGLKEEDDLLDDVEYAIAYAGVLTLTAQGLKKHDPVRSAEVLSSALAAINPHQGHVRARPMLGRILSMMAFNNMSASLAVTAEGLFRSSLDHLQDSSPCAAFDARWRLERAVALGGYGLLASKWEKRQNDAERLSSESKALLRDAHYPPPFLFPDIANMG